MRRSPSTARVHPLPAISLAALAAALPVLLTVLLLGGGPVPAGAEILRLGLPACDLEPARYCLTEPGAEYSWSGGEPRTLVPRRGLFSYFWQGQTPLWPRADLPETVSMGESIQALLVSPEPLEGLEARLGTGDGEPEMRVPAFPLSQDGRAWSVLLGVASTAEAGERSLVLRGWSGDREFEVYESLHILHREFNSESIAFNQPLSELMTIPDPRREVEYLRLREILRGRDPSALHHVGPLEVPVDTTRRTAHFGDRRLYRYADGTSARSLHNGVDFAAPTGSPVTASGAGRVVLAADRLISGLTIVLEHLPGVFSLYFHLDSLDVAEGRIVEKGERIGTVGMTGLATGPHLHWELRVSGVAVDPDSLVRSPLVDRQRLEALAEATGPGPPASESF